MNVKLMSNEELQEFLTFLSSEIERINHECERLPELNHLWAVVKDEMGQR